MNKELCQNQSGRCGLCCLSLFIRFYSAHKIYIPNIKLFFIHNSVIIIHKTERKRLRCSKPGLMGSGWHIYLYCPNFTAFLKRKQVHMPTRAIDSFLLFLNNRKHMFREFSSKKHYTT